jgi:hypothetical protein
MACVAGEIVKPLDAAVRKIPRIIACDRRLRRTSTTDYLQPLVMLRVHRSQGEAA